MDNKTKVKIENVVFRAGMNYLHKNGFYWIPSIPRLVKATGACENIDTLFEVSVNNCKLWFGKDNESRHKAYLSQTGQLYLESLVPELGKVFCVGSSFRAEPVIDDRHLIEFQMVEIEFDGGFDELLTYIEGFVYYIVGALYDEGMLQSNIVSCPYVFPKTTYDGAIDTLQNMGEIIEWGDDINSSQEAKLVEYYGNIPIFITRFPDPSWDHGKPIKVEKFFNMLPDPDNPGRVLSADLILPNAGEAVGAASRVHEYKILKDRLINSRMFKRLVEKGGSIDDFGWYLNTIKERGSVPHSGCGFGMTRILKWLIGCDNIADAVVFPSNRGTII